MGRAPASTKQFTTQSTSSGRPLEEPRSPFRHLRRRIASINDLPVAASERKHHWPLGRRPDDHPGLSALGDAGMRAPASAGRLVRDAVFAGGGRGGRGRGGKGERRSAASAADAAPSAAAANRAAETSLREKKRFMAVNSSCDGRMLRDPP